MADYRLSAQVISRGKGQSSIASAAYRAAARLHDERTGETHDYTRKQGVVYSAVLAPDDAPDWMRDRGLLWQGVEAAEKRRDAQLARELQLSLPHELTDEQRHELLVGFVRDQFVSRGMIADVAIHRPDRDGDERNHHAHIMLTMRSLTGEGFGNKVRDWNEPDTLLQWREAWARHQNRELERHGHHARVDHRSYEDRGIDREPTQHMGPTAADMERKGRPSRIGDENRARDETNAARADRYREQWRAAQAEKRFEAWAHQKAAEVTRGFNDRLQLDKAELAKRHALQGERLASALRDQYGTHKATMTAELASVDRRLEATGVRKFVRGIFGRTRSDEIRQQDLRATIASITQREDEARHALKKRQATELHVLRSKSDEGRARVLAGIERKREERRHAGWTGKPTPAPRFERPAADHAREDDRKPLQQSFREAGRNVEPAPQSAPRATQERERREKLAEQSRSWWEKERGDQSPSNISTPWRSNLNQKRPWESNFGRSAGPTRERDRSDEPPKNEKD